MYTISYRKIAVEFTALNLLVLAFFSQTSLSFQALCGLLVGLNIVAGLAFFIPRRTYQVQVQPQALVLYTFSLADRRKAHAVPYADLQVTYRQELVGKGIRQRKVRVYEHGALRTVLGPTLSGWQHHTLGELVAELKQHKVAVQTDEA
jgi:hypothetical protein